MPFNVMSLGALAIAIQAAAYASGLVDKTRCLMKEQAVGDEEAVRLDTAVEEIVEAKFERSAGDDRTLMARSRIAS
jgi:hypothetical protein